MTKQSMRDIKSCDFCGAEQDYCSHCINCGKDMCRKCEEQQGTEYKHGVYFSGSDDGLYCGECHAVMLKRPTELFRAYQQISWLRKEDDLWRANFKIKVDDAQKRLKEALGK